MGLAGLLSFIAFSLNNPSALLSLFSRTKVVGRFILYLKSTKCIELKLFPENSYVRNQDLEDQISRGILNEIRGVRVVWLPPDGVKSTTLSRVLNLLCFQKAISGVLHIRFSSSVNSSISSLREHIFPFLHWTAHNHLSDYLTDNHVTCPFVVYFDQLDHAQHHPQLSDFIVGLAEDARETRRFVVVVNVTDSIFATKILSWNGGEKITKVLPDDLAPFKNSHRLQELRLTSIMNAARSHPFVWDFCFHGRKSTLLIFRGKKIKEMDFDAWISKVRLCSRCACLWSCTSPPNLIHLIHHILFIIYVCHPARHLYQY